jgi:hypothetical protein
MSSRAGDGGSRKEGESSRADQIVKLPTWRGGPGPLKDPVSDSRPQPQYRPYGTVLNKGKFKKFRVIGLVYHTPDYMGNAAVHPSDRNRTLTHLGTWVFSKYRKAIALMKHEQHCICIPIFTHSGNGLARQRDRAQYIGVRNADDATASTDEEMADVAEHLYDAEDDEDNTIDAEDAYDQYSEAANQDPSQSPHGYVLVKLVDAYRQITDATEFHDIQPNSNANFARPFAVDYETPVMIEGDIESVRDQQKLIELYCQNCKNCTNCKNCKQEKEKVQEREQNRGKGKGKEKAGTDEEGFVPALSKRQRKNREKK